MDASKYYKGPEETKESVEQGKPSSSIEEPKKTMVTEAQPTNSLYHKLTKLLDNRAVLIGAALVILLIAVYARMGLIGNQGLFEPDGFFYYTYIRATINNHFLEPLTLGLSGFPFHNRLGEAPILLYIVVVPYLLLAWSGLSYLTIMRWMPVIFGLIEIVLAYLIAKELSNSRFLGLLAMFFVAVSSGNVARSAALVFRGDSFITVPLMVALYLLIVGLKRESTKALAFFSLAGGFVISTGILIWNGSPFVVAIYMLSIAVIVLYSFIKGSKILARKAVIFTLGLILTFLLQNAYVALHGARPGLQLQGNSFLVFFIPILAAALFTYYIVDKKHITIFSSLNKRLTFALLACIALIFVVVLLFPSYVTNITIAAGVSPPPPTNANQSTVINHAVGATTQELQSPTYPFLFASFGLQLFLAPIGVILFLLFGGIIAGNPDNKRSGFGTTAVAAFLVLLVYFGVTAYLQYNAIRYNALLSIPMAIFAAYGLYGFMMLCTKVDLKSKALMTIFAAVIYIVALYVLYKAYTITTSGLTGNSLIFVGAGIAIAAMVLLVLLDTAIAWARSGLKLYKVALAILGIILVFSFAYCVVEAFGSVQADGINTQFLSAMTWMKNNTQTNATVLALWPDGSVVEGWANRTSYMDSVGGENSTRIYYFAKFLVNNSFDNQYLYNIGKPQYLVSRQYWMVELPGLISEGVPSNPNIYSYTLLYPIGQPEHNATAQFYRFGNGYYNVTVVGTSVFNATEYKAYLSVGGPYQQIGRIVFYNVSNYDYSVINSTASGANYTMMVFFSGNRISGGMLLTDQLYNSNLFKFVFLCNYYQCSYNTNSSSGIKLTTVYMNNDTRIFKVTYP